MLTRIYFFYKVIRFFARYFPLRFNYAVAILFADIFYVFPTDIKKSVEHNLKIIYELKRKLDSRLRGNDGEMGGNNNENVIPSGSEESVCEERFLPSVEMTRLVGRNDKRRGRELFRNFGKYLIDLVCMDALPREEIDKLFLEIQGREYLDAVKNRGAIIVTLHMGNWELGGAFLTRGGYDFTAIYERHADKKVSEFFNNIRLKHKFGIIDRRDLKGLIQAVKEKRNIAILGDISYDSQTVLVDFLGIRYGLPAGAVVLALKFGIPIIPAVCVKSGSGYKILVSPLMEMEKVGHLQDNIRINAQRLAKVLEGFILEFPEQWFVFKRFDEN
ncbi:MAG: lysophospholipid acyltransferase family protein [bacterium]